MKRILLAIFVCVFLLIGCSNSQDNKNEKAEKNKLQIMQAESTNKYYASIFVIDVDSASESINSNGELTFLDYKSSTRYAFRNGAFRDVHASSISEPSMIERYRYLLGNIKNSSATIVDNKKKEKYIVDFGDIVDRKKQNVLKCVTSQKGMYVLTESDIYFTDIDARSGYDMNISWNSLKSIYSEMLDKSEIYVDKTDNIFIVKKNNNEDAALKILKISPKNNSSNEAHSIKNTEKKHNQMDDNKSKDNLDNEKLLQKTDASMFKIRNGTLIKYLGGYSKAKSIIIPSSVKKIARHAFSLTKKEKSRSKIKQYSYIKIPKNVDISDGAFSGAGPLIVTFQEGRKWIEGYTFENIGNAGYISKVILPKTTEIIGDRSFFEKRGTVDLICNEGLKKMNSGVLNGANPNPLPESVYYCYIDLMN